jgi:hypothetical protein
LSRQRRTQGEPRYCQKLFPNWQTTCTESLRVYPGPRAAGPWTVSRRSAQTELAEDGQGGATLATCRQRETDYREIQAPPPPPPPRVAAFERRAQKRRLFRSCERHTPYRGDISSHMHPNNHASVVRVESAVCSGGLKQGISLD